MPLANIVSEEHCVFGSPILVLDVPYPNLFVTRRFVPGVSKRVRIRYLGSRLMLGLSISVRVGG